MVNRRHENDFNKPGNFICGRGCRQPIMYRTLSKYFSLATLLLICKGNFGLQKNIFFGDFLKIFNNISFELPTLTLSNDDVNETDVLYYLYTRQRSKILVNKAQIAVNKKHPVKILVHGWTEHHNVTWCENISDAYLKKGFYNIISTDWSSKGDSDYLTASRFAKPIGEKIGGFIVKLHEKRGIPMKNIHLISHSLGSHVAGFAGKRVFELTGRKVSRITALDPAAPIFDFVTTGNTERLSKDDADFVDVVHTDGGSLGFRFSIGTVDFFPNGGTAVQPGCSLVKLDVKYEDLFCSHASSHQYFIKSIGGKKFLAKPCESWDRYSRGGCERNKAVLLGDDVPRTASGNYYLRTNESDIHC